MQSNSLNRKYNILKQNTRNSGEVWTNYEDHIILNKGDRSDMELSKILGRSVSSIQSRRCRISKIGKII